jgi:predicted secreted protein
MTNKELWSLLAAERAAREMAERERDEATAEKTAVLAELAVALGQVAALREAASNPPLYKAYIDWRERKLAALQAQRPRQERNDEPQK